MDKDTLELWAVLEVLLEREQARRVEAVAEAVPDLPDEGASVPHVMVRETAREARKRDVRQSERVKEEQKNWAKGRDGRRRRVQRREQRWPPEACAS